MGYVKNAVALGGAVWYNLKQGVQSPISKILSYVFLYKSQGERENAIPFSEITLTIFCYRHPRKLFRQLEEMGVTVTVRQAGIYALDGYPGLFVQIVLIGELPRGTVLPLRVLRPRADSEDVGMFCHQIPRFQEQGELNNLRAVLRISSNANQELYRKLMKEVSDMMTMEETGRLLFPSLWDKVSMESREAGHEDIIKIMLRDNVPLPLIERYTQASPERIMETARSIGVTLTTG